MVLQFYMFYHRCTMRMIEVQQTKGCKKEKERKSLKQFIYFNAPMYFIMFPAQIFQHFNLTFESSTGPMTDDSFRWCQAVVVVVWETQHTGIWAKAVKDMGQGSRRIREMDHFFWMNPSFVWNHMDLTPYIYIYTFIWTHLYRVCIERDMNDVYQKRYVNVFHWCLTFSTFSCLHVGLRDLPYHPTPRSRAVCFTLYLGSHFSGCPKVWGIFDGNLMGNTQGFCWVFV